MRKVIILSLLSAAMLLSSLHAARAQRVSVGTNVLGWADFITINAECNVAFSRYFTADVRLRYNPWTFNKGDADRQIQNRKRSVAAGVRYWPWHIFSGWWFGLDAQVQEYNWGGFWSNPSEEGFAYGGVISAGYTHMLSDHWNIEFGLGAYLGGTSYRQYECAMCGRITEDGSKFFWRPDELKVSFVYIF